MNVAEIMDTIRSVAGKQTTNDLDGMILNDINRAYRKLCRSRTFGALIVRGEQITTVTGTMIYRLPYPMDKIIEGTLRYDVTTMQAGYQIVLQNASDETRASNSACTPNGYNTVVASISRGPNTEADAIDTATVNSGDMTVTLANPLTITPNGYYIRFGTDANGKNGGDYGYKISQISSNILTISSPYRGPSLKDAYYEITPLNTPWLTFDPTFTDSAKTVQFDWYSKPARLYNPDDVPEVTELGDAIVYRVLADNPLYHRPESYDRLNYDKLAREYMLSGFKSGAQ